MKGGQYTYSPDVVTSLLNAGAIFDEEFGVLAAKAEREGGSGGDPSHGNGLVVMLADLTTAWRRLSRWDQELLEARHKHELGFEVIAFLAGLPGAHEAAERTDAAMERMLQSLNRFTYIERVDAG